MNEKVKSVWSKCLSLLQETIPTQAFTTWFEPIKPISLEDNSFTVQVPSQFFYEWLEQHYSALINKVITSVIHPEAKLIYSVVVDPSKSNKSVNLPSMQKKSANSPNGNGKFFLSERYTFDNFVEGDSNKFARAASLAVAQAPGKTSFNPLLIYGGVGLGKTHLIQAIGNFAKFEGLASRVLYVSSEKFTLEFINSIQKGTTAEFSKSYRNVDILLVDDIQFLANKEATQKEFFHTFNTLHQNGKQIVLSSDRPPKELVDMEERLISRFQWGLVVDIQPPELETRQAILQKKALENGIEIADEILHFIASHIKSNIRELEGALIRLLAYASLEKQDITLDFSKYVLRDVCIPRARALSIEQIQKFVSDHFGIPDDMLRAKTRKKEIANARQIAMYFCKNFTENSLKTIGLHFGGRDHTTVIHAITTVEKELKNDKQMKEAVEIIKRKIEIAQL